MLKLAGIADRHILRGICRAECGNVVYDKRVVQLLGGTLWISQVTSALRLFRLGTQIQCIATRTSTLFCFFRSHLLSLHCCTSSLSFVTQIRGHTAGSTPPGPLCIPSSGFGGVGQSQVTGHRRGQDRVLDTVCQDLGREQHHHPTCLLYTSPSPRDKRQSRMPSSA